MQVALVEMQRRVQGRVPLPWIQPDPAWVADQQRAGRPLVRFQDIPLEWSDFRLTFRQTADILLRFEALDRAEHAAIVSMGREGDVLQPIVSQWYAVSSGFDTSRRHRADASERAGEPRAGARAGDTAISQPLRRGDCATRRFIVVDARPLPVLRMGARLRCDYTERRAPAHLRPVRRPMGVRAVHLPVLRQRRSRAGHVVCDARRTLPRLRVRRVPPLYQGLRRPRRHAARHGFC